MLEFLTTLSWAAVFQIILIDILLGGDNAVVIALACRNLPKQQRMRGILWGTVGAIVLRVILIAFALTLLDIPFLKLVGGVLLFWIGVKLLLDDDEEHDVQGGSTLFAAIKTIIIAIAAAAQNADPGQQLGLVIFGLLVSVPIIVWGSTLVLKLIDRFPIVVTLGAALLGWIAGGMLVTDQILINPFGEPSTMVKLTAEGIGAVLIVAAGKWIASRKRASAPAEAAAK